MTAWPATVLAPVMQWDYGDAARGPSCEDAFFVRSLRGQVDRVETAWIDPYLQDPAGLRRLVLEACERTRPDLVFFVPYQDQLTVELLEEVRRTAVTVAWFGDDQWRFDSFTRRYAPHVDVPVTTDPLGVERYRALGLDPVVSQWAAVRPEPVPEVVTEETGFRYGVSFVGGRSPYRAWFVRQLAKLGVAVECWGAGWPGGRLDAAGMQEVMRTSRVNLNLSNSPGHDLRYVISGKAALREYLRATKRAEQVKARNFEIAAAGGFQLTAYCVGLEDYLGIGPEVAVFTSPEDCALQVRRWLADPAGRVAVAQGAQRRVLAEHTYDVRMRVLLDEVAARRR